MAGSVAYWPGPCEAAYRTRVPVEPGLTATASLTVSETDTAIACESGDVPVLSTPRVVALCEQATMLATRDRLAEGDTSVGATIQISHVSPAPVGSLVVAEATLDKIEGRRLHFSVTVTDEQGLIAAGKVTRAVVTRSRFLGKLDASS